MTVNKVCFFIPVFQGPIFGKLFLLQILSLRTWYWRDFPLPPIVYHRMEFIA